MQIRILALLAAAAIALVACGGGDATGIQGEVAEQTITELQAEGVSVDEGCVHDAAKDLSDADATAIINGGELSEEGEEIGLRMFLQCVDLDDLDG